MVEHSFQEVIRQYKRMCRGKACSDCDFYKFKTSLNYQMACLRFLKEYPVEAEALVMNWAAEHPIEYPYMIDVLHDVFNMPKSLNVSNTGIWEWLNTIRISEEMAVKLGIEPKEE